MGFLMKIAFLTAAILAMAPSATAETPRAWVASSMSNVFKDTPAPARPATAISWLAARNEAESAQICVRNDTPFTVNSITVTDLTCGGSQIPASALSCNFVEFVHYQKNSVNLTHRVRTGAADYPDPLSNETSMAVPANITQPIWVTVKIPKGQPAGIYQGSVTVATTAGAIVVPISLEVVNAGIPDSSQGFSNALMWDVGYGVDNGITMLYGYKPYTPEWWNILGKICDNAVANRTNVGYIVPMQLMLDGGSYRVSDTEYVFKWDRFDQMMGFLLAKGFRRVYAEGLASSDYEDKALPVYVEVIGGDQFKPTQDEADVGSDKMKNYLHAYLTALKNHLAEKGWLDLYATQIFDEPRDVQAADWDTIAACVPPEIKIIETFFRVTPSTARIIQSHAGTLDIWVPSIQLYQDSAGKCFLDGRKAAGDEKWFYTYGNDAYGWLTRLIDSPVYENRLLFWYAFKNDMDGYLHWGYSWWGEKTDDGDQKDVHGDARLVYPDVARNAVKSSIREANQRDGVEDLELFRILKKRDPALAQEIVDAIVTSGTVYSNDISRIAAQRERLLRAVASGNP